MRTSTRRLALAAAAAIAAPAIAAAAGPVTVGPASTQVKNTRFTVTVSCPADRESCTGALNFASATAIDAYGTGRAKKVERFGTRTFTAAGGTQAKVNMRILGPALAYLTRRGSLAVRVDVTLDPPNGARFASRVTLKYRR